MKFSSPFFLNKYQLINKPINIFIGGNDNYIFELNETLATKRLIYNL